MGQCCLKVMTPVTNCYPKNVIKFIKEIVNHFLIHIIVGRLVVWKMDFSFLFWAMTHLIWVIVLTVMVCVGGDEHWGQHSGDSLPWLNANLICFENVEMLKLASFVTISILAQLLQEQRILLIGQVFSFTFTVSVVIPFT